MPVAHGLAKGKPLRRQLPGRGRGKGMPISGVGAKALAEAGSAAAPTGTVAAGAGSSAGGSAAAIGKPPPAIGKPSP